VYKALITWPFLSYSSNLWSCGDYAKPILNLVDTRSEVNFHSKWTPIERQLNDDWTPIERQLNDDWTPIERQLNDDKVNLSERSERSERSICSDGFIVMTDLRLMLNQIGVEPWMSLIIRPIEQKDAEVAVRLDTKRLEPFLLPMIIPPSSLLRNLASELLEAFSVIQIPGALLLQDREPSRSSWIRLEVSCNQSLMMIVSCWILLYRHFHSYSIHG